MPRSSNGWPATPSIRTRKLIVEGVEFVGGIVDNDDVETVLRYCMENYHRRVEPLHNPGCWGGYYRANRNDPNSLSNHASRTALDANAPSHPNGVATTRTFSAAQIATCRAIVREVDAVVRWGGDYRTTPDAMHWEINADAARVHAAAAKIRAAAKPAPTPKQTVRAGLRKIIKATPGGALKKRLQRFNQRLKR